MLPDRVSNPGPLTYESGVLPIALRGPASSLRGQLVEYFTTSYQNTLIFFVEKNERSFLHFFNKKYWRISDINV